MNGLSNTSLPSTSLAARMAAAALVSAVLDDGRTLDDALASTRSYAGLEGRDRSFARAIASATLRRLGGVDQVLSRFLARPLPQEAREARALLRTGAAQILVLRAAPHAVVNETVTLAHGNRSAQRFHGLMNAVLRKVATQGLEAFEALPAGADLPDWLYARWRATYGAQASELALSLREEAPLDLTVRSDARRWAETWNGAATTPWSVRAPLQGSVTSLPGFDEGAFWVQDLAASLPARLLGEVAGLRVLDLCAAPGGKTLQLAAAGAHVTALDVSEERLGLLRDNLARCRLSAEVVCADARGWAPTALFDAVLLDAPCTATGTLRRHPDAAWLRRPSDILALSALQDELLARALGFVRPGGVLVYAVCSLEPEEGPERVARLTLDPIKPEEIAPLPASLLDGGALRTLPAHLAELGGMDGFYAARIRLAN